jgi:transcriptional regulator with PAS, ATPase and Fis domain
MPIFIPPLKERPEDILVFAHKFIDEFNEKYHRRKKLSQQAYDAFLHYDWPGNVRELENVVERLVISCQDELINEMQVHGALPINNGMRVEVNEVVPLNRALDDLERKLILRAYQNYGTTRKAAEALEINQSTVVRKLKKIRESKR